MLSWKIKICGITNVADAQAVARFGADAIGLNFYPRSLRCVSPEKALAITNATPAAVARIGVFVNDSIANINATVTDLPLTATQLHGDESPVSVDEIEGEVLRAVRVFPGQLEAAQKQIQAWSDAGVSAILLDAGGRGGYGGSGKQLDWKQVSALAIDVPLVLAGGLNCDNVAQAIETVRPAAVDVASGVENFPGKKDHELLKRFIDSALEAFSRL